MTAKYKLGDVVYHPSTKTKKKPCICVTCDGTGKVVFKTAVEDITTKCPYCNGRGDYEHTEFEPGCDKLTIGRVQTTWSEGLEISQYMCKETGIGSGTLYEEEILYATPEQATAASAYQNAARIQMQQETMDTALRSIATPEEREIMRLKSIIAHQTRMIAQLRTQSTDCI